MKTIRHCLLLLPALIGLAVIATSCDDSDAPEDPILRPLEQHHSSLSRPPGTLHRTKSGRYNNKRNPQTWN